MADTAPTSPTSDKLASPSTLLNNGFPDPTEDVIPPTHTHRTLVLCFDGTGDQFKSDVGLPWYICLFFFSLSHYPQNSNIVQFFSMLAKDDPSQQMVYYQVGFFLWLRWDSRLPLTGGFISTGWHRHLYHSSNSDTILVQDIQDPRHDAWKPPRCTCYGYAFPLGLIHNSHVHIATF